MTEQLQKGFSQEEAIILHFQGITISYEHFWKLSAHMQILLI